MSAPSCSAAPRPLSLRAGRSGGSAGDWEFWYSAWCCCTPITLPALKSWREQSRSLSPAQKSLDVAVSFIIPTFILVIILTQMQAFFGYRFNLLLTTLAQFRYSLPNVFILMLVGTIPDYLQGLIKLYWTLITRK